MAFALFKELVHFRDTHRPALPVELRLEGGRQLFQRVLVSAALLDLHVFLELPLNLVLIELLLAPVCFRADKTGVISALGQRAASKLVPVLVSACRRTDAEKLGNPVGLGTEAQMVGSVGVGVFQGLGV